MIRRRIAALAAGVGAAALVLTACGGGSSASSGGDIEVGAYAPLTGSLASPGTILTNGMKLKFDQVNAAGGINGRKVKLTVLDDTGNAATAVTVANQLAGNKNTVAVLGSYGSSIGMPASAALEKAQVPNVQSQLSTPDAVNRGFKYLFNTYPLGEDVEKQTFLRAIEQKMITPQRVSLVYIDSPFATAAAKVITDQAAAHGYTVVSNEKIQPQQASYASTVTKIKGDNPDTVWLAVNGAEAKTLLTNMQQLGFKPTNLYGEGNPLIDPTAMASVGTLNDGVLVGTQWWPGSPTQANQTFLSDYKAAYGGEAPPQMAPGGYQAAEILVAALRSIPADTISRETVRDALAKLQNVPTVYGPVSFAPNGQLQFQALYLLQNQAGTPVVVLPTAEAKPGTKVQGYLAGAS
ncbi:amino acid ABC transporter substrate-binding protein [Pseudonocardia ailaonensis]|uniref:Amino acid ABC transporter substrate-binding protein n=1 Tax=Pseudonocardia ailaonensis TaxID=367279 RepID=A0ABN2N1L1_9PSEU